MRRVAKSRGVPKKYLSGVKDKSKRAEEIKKTARDYRAGKNIDVARISRERANDKTKTIKRKNKKSFKRKSR